MRWFHHGTGGKRVLRRNLFRRPSEQAHSAKRLDQWSGLSRKQRIQARIRHRSEGPWYKPAIAVALLLAITVVSARLPSSAYFIEGAKERTTSDQLVIDFVGDIMLGRSIMSLGEASGYETLFAKVSGFWDNADLVFANLESAVLMEDVSEFEEADKSIHLWSTYEGLSAAMDAGVNVWACANNHAFDYGERAVLELAYYFDEHGVMYSGIGYSLEDAASYQIIEQDGMKIAFISITDVYFSESMASESQAGVLTTGWTDYNLLVYQASQEADLTVVYIHWGEENETSVNDTQVSIGHQLANAGADIIIGSHPHVVQEVELYGDSIIFYSLGNFIFDQGNTYARDSVMVEYTVDQDGSGAFRLYTVRIADGIPRVTTNWFYQTRINRELSQGLQDGSYYLDEDGFIVIPFDIFVDEDKDTGA